MVLRAWVHALAWLGLTTALSQIPAPVAVPGLGANLAAWWVTVSVLYWLPVDGVLAAGVGLLTAIWARLPFTPWGPGHGVTAGVVLPLGVFTAAGITTHYANVYHHEHADYLKGASRTRTVLTSVHTTVWGIFHAGLRAMVLTGRRPALKSALDRAERQTLRHRSEVPWVNWAHTAGCQAHGVYTPQTVQDLVDAVADARARGQRIRVVASGFSWSSLVPTDDALIFCERLDGITVDTSDPARPAVWAEAGVTNRQLNAELARHGLCMPWNVVLETVRIAGIVSAGTHGSGQFTSTVGDLVEALEVIDARGTVRTLSEETLGVEGMSAARLGLGLFGVIARVKLRVIQNYRVRQTDTRLPATAMLDRLPDLVRTHDALELYWFPFGTDVWMRTVDRTTEPSTARGHGFWFKTLNFIQNAWLMVFASLVRAHAPSLTPALLRVGFEFLPFKTRVIDLPASHHYHHWIEMMPSGCMEVGFKVDADLANVREAWAVPVRLVDQYARRGLYPLNLTVNMRFTGPSSTLLSPAYGEGLTCYIEIMWQGRPEGWQAFSSELCHAWLKTPGALPHWSKEFEHVPGVVPLIRQALGTRRTRFLAALVATGIDPTRAFSNPMLRQVLLDEAPPA